MTTIKYSDAAKCPKCKGELSYDATIKDRLPLGFGFRGSKFVIDCIARSGFRGECMDCGTKVFAVKTQRRVSVKPRGINDRIKLARVG
jgi:hypothetical protein